MTIPDEIMEGAQNGRDWFDAYLAVGFNEEQALQLVCRPLVSVPTYQQSPELTELYSKFGVLLNRSLSEE